MVRAADFAHWNGDVSRWTVGYSVRKALRCPETSSAIVQGGMLNYLGLLVRSELQKFIFISVK